MTSTILISIPSLQCPPLHSARLQNPIQNRFSIDLENPTKTPSLLASTSFLTSNIKCQIHDKLLRIPKQSHNFLYNMNQTVVQPFTSPPSASDSVSFPAESPRIRATTSVNLPINHPLNRLKPHKLTRFPPNFFKYEANVPRNLTSDACNSEANVVSEPIFFYVKAPVLKALSYP